MKLALGSVQFGLSYGAFNTSGAVPASEVAECLDLAAAHGVDTVDTARSYGESENVLGRLQAAARFRIVTKVAPLNGRGAARVSESVKESLAALKTDRVYGLMLHRSDDLLGPRGPDVWRALHELKEGGVAERIGVSVYAPDEAQAVARRYPIGILQAPFNAFDQRFRTSGAFERLADEGVEVHVRSIFLQGFALADPQNLPPQLAGYRSLLMAFRQQAVEAGVRPLDLALAAAAHEPAIARVVVGVQSVNNLRDILMAAVKPPPACDPAAFATEDQALINPSTWTRAA